MKTGHKQGFLEGLAGHGLKVAVFVCPNGSLGEAVAGLPFVEAAGAKRAPRGRGAVQSTRYGRLAGG